jgi:hypothetical protein
MTRPCDVLTQLLLVGRVDAEKDTALPEVGAITCAKALLLSSFGVFDIVPPPTLRR